MNMKKTLSNISESSTSRFAGVKDVTLWLGVVAVAVGGIAMVPSESFAQNRAFVEIEQQRNLPIRGQSQAKVRSQYGEPTSATPAVGQPPISRWIYPGFTVYFEYSHVITTVAEEDLLPVSLNNIQ